MAYFGLSKPWFAKLGAEGTYTDGFQCGKAISTTITPSVSEGNLYADNMQVEYVSEFKSASVTVGTDRLPKEAATVIFGHTVDENGQISYNSADAANYVGYGFTVMEVVDGKKQYRACILPRVKFNEGEDSYQTKGDSIAFATPSISGTALPMEDGEWKIISQAFDTEALADAWVKQQLNVQTAG